jgi:hypothetical protein
MKRSFEAYPKHTTAMCGSRRRCRHQQAGWPESEGFGLGGKIDSTQNLRRTAAEKYESVARAVSNPNIASVGRRDVDGRPTDIDYAGNESSLGVDLGDRAIQGIRDPDEAGTRRN